MNGSRCWRYLLCCLKFIDSKIIFIVMIVIIFWVVSLLFSIKSVHVLSKVIYVSLIPILLVAEVKYEFRWLNSPLIVLEDPTCRLLVLVNSSWAGVRLRIQQPTSQFNRIALHIASNIQLRHFNKRMIYQPILRTSGLEIHRIRCSRPKKYNRRLD